MHQTEIEFFWPLTEQIPLPLDFTDCSKPKLYMPAEGQFSFFPNGATVASTVSATGVTIDCGTLTVRGMPMPWYRKLVFKIMGFKWK